LLVIYLLYHFSKTHNISHVTEINCCNVMRYANKRSYTKYKI